jgi:hypothetical protein
MDVNAAGALSAYAYQSALSQTGNASQALSQALAASQAQVAQTSSLFTGVGPIDPMATLAGGAESQSQASLYFGASSATGNASGTVQGLLSSLLGGSNSALFSGSDSLPSSAALLTGGALESLVRYAYDQSQNPTASSQQLAASAQQTALTSGLNLLA